MTNGFLFTIIKLCLRSKNIRFILNVVGDYNFSVFECNGEILDMLYKTY